MRLKNYFLAAILATTIIACQKNTEDVTDAGSEGTGSDNFVTNSKDTSFTNAVTITFNDSTAVVTNDFSGSGVTVAVTKNEVVVNATVTTTEVNYVLKGKTGDGSFKLYSDYKFNLVLNGVSIINNDGPAINIQSGKKVTVNVLSGTNNRLIDGSTYATSTEDQKGTFFSEGQLNFAGTGALTVTGNYKHGIVSDDYIAIKEGNITIAKAASDGIHAKDYFKAEGGTLNITATGDGIDCDEGYVLISGGTINITSVDDGITASYDEATDVTITPYVQITGGTVTVTTSGQKGHAINSESYTSINSTGTITLKTTGQGSKGIKTTGNFSLLAGTVSITTTGNAYYDTDDADITAAAGIKCDGNLTVAAGTLTINSNGTGGKGITVDGTSAYNGGTVNITTTGAAYTYSGNSTEAKTIKSDGALIIAGAALTLSSMDDAIKSETSITITSGNITISKSVEGIEAPYITIADGTINVTSSDDCLNATKGNGGESNDGSLLTISGGNVYLSSTNGDPMDSNGSIVMTGGTTIVQGPSSQPEVALDYNGTFNISGGLLLASGPNSGNMIQATSNTSAQYTALIKVNGNIAAGTLVSIEDASGNVLATYKPTRAAYYLVFSSPSLLSGSSYKLYTGGSYTGGTTVNGYATGGTYSGGTQKGTFTISSKLSTVTL